MNEPTGIKRALNAAWEQLPHILIAAIIAICVFVGGLWLDHRDLRSVVDGLAGKHDRDTVCAVVATCPLCERLVATIAEAKMALVAADNHIESHNREADQWKQRIIRLEQQMFDMRTTVRTNRQHTDEQESR